MRKQAIGIFGGTFDPIHFGHLRTALELYQSLELANVRLVPCYQPVHRKVPVASPEHRLAMVKAAVAKEPALIIDACEIERKAPSFTVETLEILRQQFPDTPFCLIMGIDALLGFTSWHRWQDILSLTHLVIAHRPQYQLPKTGAIAELLKQRLQTSPLCVHDALSGYIVLQPVTALEISATDIRRQFASGRNPRFLLPNSVYDYIQKEKVYSIG